MPFFDKPKPPKPRKQSRRLRRDEYGRPTLTLPGYLPDAFVLAASDQAAVMVHGFACHPEGFAFQLEVTKRHEPPPGPDPEPEPFGIWHPHAEPGARFGIGYSDGRRATLERTRSPGRYDDPGAQLGIMQSGGQGGSGHWRSELWVQPLPPPGPVTFAVEWPDAGIEETLHAIDGQLFQDAAARAQSAFPARRRKKA